MEEKERYELIGYCSYRDTETGVIGDNFVEVLNQQDQKIKSLDHRLAHSIEPKFKTYQQVYTISKFYTSTNGIPEYEIFSSYYYVAENENEIIVGWNYKKDFNQRKYNYIRKDWVFATEEEAKAKLREIQDVTD